MKIKHNYKLSSKNIVFDCSESKRYKFLLNDLKREEAWERFGASSLPGYFLEGVEKFSDSVNRFKDLSKPVTSEFLQQLEFMLDSLIYVRQLINNSEDTD